MNNQIHVRITRNYGSRAVYPVCEVGHKFARLLNTKTFTPATIQQLKDLGYEFVVEAETIV